MFTAMLFLTLAPIALAGPSDALQRFVARKDDAFKWQWSSDSRLRTIELTSQRWKGFLWKHNVVVVEPDENALKGVAILIVTGAQRDRDIQLAKGLANLSGMTVATLFDVPNQPLWDMKEDDLIAHTFQKFLESGDEDWPLLLPMANSAAKAMDALQQAYPGRFSKFVVTGASKRGWTTWLTGALDDKRVAGIAPLVIDNLNIPVQMKRQEQYWKGFSPEIDDYTRRGLQQLLNAPRSKRLMELVDPYSYRAKITAPTLIVNGACDPYWTVDALSVYWNKLSQPKWAVIVPNKGHGIDDYSYWTPTLATFARACAGTEKMPTVNFRLTTEKGKLNVEVSSSVAIGGVRLWEASSPDLHFQNKTWSPVALAAEWGADRKKVKGSVAVRSGVNGAWYAEAEFTLDRRTFRVTSPAKVIRK
jgi:PhoPQ-activated pathogenicity-related protein